MRRPKGAGQARPGALPSRVVMPSAPRIALVDLCGRLSHACCRSSSVVLPYQAPALRWPPRPSTKTEGTLRSRCSRLVREPPRAAWCSRPLTSRGDRRCDSYWSEPQTFVGEAGAADRRRPAKYVAHTDARRDVHMLTVATPHTRLGHQLDRD